MDKQSKKNSKTFFKNIFQPSSPASKKKSDTSIPTTAKAKTVDNSVFYYSSKISEVTELSRSTSVTKAVEELKAQENLESTRLIWYDPNINKNDDTKQTMNELRQINDYVIFLTDIDVFTNYIRSISNEKMVLVVSGRAAASLLNNVHDLRQVDSIFIFCWKPETYEPLLDKFPKVVGLYVKRQHLIRALQENVSPVEKYLETFNFFDQHKQKSMRDLSKESAEFLWFQMFKDVVLKVPKDIRERQQMIKFCRHYYRENQKELKFINEFENGYQSNKAIEWYMKETFLYKSVNKALRTEDIEQLHIFRFFIVDLSFSLASEHEKLRQKGEKVTMLYRGLKLEADELRKLKENEGNLLSANGFLSTSRAKERAIAFATKPIKRTGVVSVLYEIECNLKQLNSIVFADTAPFSAYPEEAEVLFDIGATFEIISVKADIEFNLWTIKLRASDKGSKATKEYIELNRNEEEETNIELIFGSLLIDMGQYDQALKYFHNLLTSNTTEKDDIAKINNLIGSVYYHKDDLDRALEYHELAYNSFLNDKPSRIKDSVRPLVNIGLVYHRKGQHDRALDSYMKSIELFETYYGKEHIKIAKTLMQIGNIYTETQDYQRALEYYGNVLKIQQKVLHVYHMDTATTLNNIAVVYEKLNDFEKALEYYEQSLDMKQKVLPPDHKDITLARTNMRKIIKKKDHPQDLDSRDNSPEPDDRVQESCRLDSEDERFTDDENNTD